MEDFEGFDLVNADDSIVNDLLNDDAPLANDLFFDDNFFDNLGEDLLLDFVDMIPENDDPNFGMNFAVDLEPKKIAEKSAFVGTDYPNQNVDSTSQSISMLNNPMDSKKKKKPVKFNETFEKTGTSGRIGRIPKSRKKSPKGKRENVRKTTKVVMYPRALNWVKTPKEVEEWPKYKEKTKPIFGMYPVEGTINKNFTGNLLTSLGNFADLRTLQNIPNACEESKVSVRIYSNYCRDGVTCGAYEHPEFGSLFTDSMKKYIVVDLIANDVHNEKIKDCCIAIDDEKLVRVIAVKKSGNRYTFISAPVKVTNSNKDGKVTLFGMGRGSTRPMLREYKIVLFNQHWKVEKKINSVIINAKGLKDFFSENKTRTFEKAIEFLPMCIDDLV